MFTIESKSPHNALCYYTMHYGDFFREQNDKPGYVVNVHLSSTIVANRIKQPT